MGQGRGLRAGRAAIPPQTRPWAHGLRFSWGAGRNRRVSRGEVSTQARASAPATRAARMAGYFFVRHLLLTILLGCVWSTFGALSAAPLGGEPPPRVGPPYLVAFSDPPAFAFPHEGDADPPAAAILRPGALGVSPFNATEGGGRRAQQVAATWCPSGGTVAMTAIGSFGVVDTGNPYLNARSCSVLFTMTSPYNRVVTFSRFATEASYDFFSLFSTAATTGPTHWSSVSGASGGANPTVGLTYSLGVGTAPSAPVGVGYRFTSDNAVQAAGIGSTIYYAAQYCNLLNGGTALFSVGGIMYLFPMNGFGAAYANSVDCRYTVGAPAGYVPNAYIWGASTTEASTDFQFIYNNGAATTVNTAAPLLASASGTITACPSSTPCTASGQYIGVRFLSDPSVTTTTPPVVVVQLAIVAAGSYRTLTGFVTACPAGYYGATAGLTTSTCTGLCLAGYFGSATGQSASTCNGLCACGTWGGAGMTATTCTGQCTAGRYGLTASVRTAATCDGACTAGFYCPAGSCSATQNACPPGTYGGSTGLTTAACTGPCSIGYYGATGGLTVNTCTGPCAAGYYGSATGQTASTCSGLCACGTWGSAGVTSTTCTGQCTAGRYGLATSVRFAATCDGACTAGFYCPAGSCTATAVQCPAGSFCPAGSGAPMQCPGGHYCPAGTSSWAHLNCWRGSYCPDGSAAPTPCPIQIPPPPYASWAEHPAGAQGPAFLTELSGCLNSCFWNSTSGDGFLSNC
jgi:hypothetical protein